MVVSYWQSGVIIQVYISKWCCFLVSVLRNWLKKGKRWKKHGRVIVDVKSRSYPIFVDVSERSRALKEMRALTIYQCMPKKYTPRNSNPKTLMKVSHFCHRDSHRKQMCVCAQFCSTFSPVLGYRVFAIQICKSTRIYHLLLELRQFIDEILLSLFYIYIYTSTSVSMHMYNWNVI